MEQQEAIQSALNARRRFQVPDEFDAGVAEKRIIEIVDDGRPVRDELPASGPVRDIIAWIVTLVHEGSSVEFAVDDKSGEIVRFHRSRSALSYIEEEGGLF